MAPSSPSFITPTVAVEMPMPLPAPSIIDRTKNWLKLLKRHPRSPSVRADEKTGSFSNARDFSIHDSQFIDVNEMKINYIKNVISNKDAVFEVLEPYTCLDATKDSSARHPPPKCHHDTRLKIRDRLMQWLTNEYDEWKMLWVRGSAGTGKSAVAQSFGDSCEEEEILGGSYFFSRTTGRNKLETVVPTIVYQLARNVPEYHSLVERRLAKDQLLLRSSPPVQFRKLITEPFATLQRQHPRKPIVIILDGLDECESENAQREILDMVTNAVRTHSDLPLRWLIFSRPEAHLKNAFLRVPECGREELVIDAECHENVERYVRERLTEIKATYIDILPADWPPRDELQRLLDAVSGLFIFASTCLKFIDDPEEADPRSQLDSLLTFLHQSQRVVSRNPLAALDLLYSRILEDIPPRVFQTTRKILAYMSHQDRIDRSRDLNSPQALSNFLRLDQHAFHKAVRGLHSVMYIPESGDLAPSELKFHHASFPDFLLDPHRSGKFVIGKEEALTPLIHLGIYWTEVDVTHFHSDGSKKAAYDHSHDSLPGLTWASEDNRLALSQFITKFVEKSLFTLAFTMRLDSVDEDLLCRISNCDFRCWYAWNVFFLVRLCRLDPSTSIVRIEPSSPTDHQLLEYFNRVIGNGHARPAIFPLRKDSPRRDQWTREYFFIGHGAQSVIVWKTDSPIFQNIYSLRCDQEPSKAQISNYRKALLVSKWDEEKAGLEMK